MKNVSRYKTLVFDCDGVVLDSNTVKTSAFYEATLPYGEAAAKAFVEYHTANGGISRYSKFAHFLEAIVPSIPQESKAPSIEDMLDKYAKKVRQGLLTCAVAKGLQELREHTQQARWLIVSGGDQSELREVFAERGLAGLFDGGIFGSPDNKNEILAREVANGNIQQPALFLGDSKYDYQAAKTAQLDFVFLNEWTEVNDWQEWCQEKKIKTMKNIENLVVDIFGVNS